MNPAVRLPLAAGLTVALACSTSSAGAEPRLDADAFVSPLPCRVEPFDDGGVTQYLDDVQHSCGGESTRFELASPRADEHGPGSMKAQRRDTRSFGPVLATFKLAWSAAGESDGRLRTEQAMFGAGGLLRLDPTLALRAQVGLEAADGPRNRARVAGLWKPRENDLLFAEWAGSEDATDHYAVGMRWYLMHKRVAIDVAARRTPSSSGWVEPRIGLLLPGLGE